MPADSPLRVFISYSHDSEEHAERVLRLANKLRHEGVDAWIDQYEMAPAQGWPLWMENQVEEADAVLCVCTETYALRVAGKETPGLGLGATWEGSLVRVGLYFGQGKNEKFLPIFFEPSDVEHIPTLLKASSYFQPLSAGGYENLYRHLTKQPRVSAPELGKLRSLSSQTRRSLRGSSLDASSKTADDGPLTSYADWSKERYAYLDLIGIDAGDVRVKLDEVYVPLRVAFRQSFDGEALGLFRGGRFSEEEQGPIEIEEVLLKPEPRHVLIFGEPGSGKTTALLKLHQLCWQSASALGLPDATVPVFLRLRHLTPERLDQGLAAFIEHEIHQLSGGRLSGRGEALWKHQRLLLLFDGLDEIADADHRERVLRRIGWYLHDAESMRAVVSCRRVGLPSREADRDQQFQTYEVRPFQDEQIAQLVKLWFRELARHGRIDQATADRRVNTLLTGLKDRQKSSQQILEMASNPLLLTLLCVVVLLGNEIPRKRVRFYEQCLDILLDRWPRQRGEPAPVELATVREALAHLAFYLHSNKRRDDLNWAEAVAELMEVLGDGEDAQNIFDWVHSCVGLLVDYTEEEYGFVHLGLQEHLTARHLIATPKRLEVLNAEFDKSWWNEVFQQVCALSERKGFHALMSHLLQHTDALERRSGMLRDCLQETTNPDLTAFVQVLEGSNEARQMAVLRLMNGFSFRTAEWIEALESVQRGENRDLSKAARRLLEDQAADQRLTDVALIVHAKEDTQKAKELKQLLQGWHGGWSAEVLVGLGQETGRRLKNFQAVLPLISPKGDWKQAGLWHKIHPKKNWLVATLPDDPRPTVPDVFSDCEVLDWTLDDEESLVAAIVERLQRGSVGPEVAQVMLGRSKGAAPAIAEDEPESLVEPVTGAVFLPVPGGSFVMGSDDENFFSDEWKELWREHDLGELITAPTPACRVRLSPFFLARTPVTNEQYEHFLSATGREEPSTWRDRRFSDPHQPVVNVSWEDANAYCEWLTKNHPKGYVFQLPSEAQWEYAARGPKSLKFPWGDIEPNNRLACFGLNHENDKPANVGSFPDGGGPFGHLDLAGLVWEWCRDAWEPDLSRWSKVEPLDPLGAGDPEKRPLRGGGWWDGAVNLRSAIRRWRRPRFRFDIGFRVSLSPPSLGS